MPNRKLHIGGKTQKKGWEILDAIPAEQVDHVGDALDLSQFPDQTFSELYASHVLEHFGYQNARIALQEWNRVLMPGGRLYISVPNFKMLALLILADIDLQNQFTLMKMVFGGQQDDYDYHKFGFNDGLLTLYLEETGFTNIEKVDDFGLFEDTSTMVLGGFTISINMTAEKARP